MVTESLRDIAVGTDTTEMRHHGLTPSGSRDG